MIGINISGGEFGQVGGEHDYEYHYPTFTELQYYAKGVELIRLPFRWERMQPGLDGPLDAEELALIKKVLAYAAELGIKVIIDCHNYGRYNGETIGSATGPTNAQFADFWMKLASELKNAPALAGYDIINEPHDMGGPGMWKSAA
jgi:aryl-phospho-beta-D-glucosidase BglC (GH1 family)